MFQGSAQQPYINHLIEVMKYVADATQGCDVELLMASLLHDVLEDTPIIFEELQQLFGSRVAKLVGDNTDSMELSKDERRARRKIKMSENTSEARLIKLADLTSNLRAISASPPAGWTNAKRLSYANDCLNLVNIARGTNAKLEAAFDEVLSGLQNHLSTSTSVSQEPECSLDFVVGQSVFLVHVPNTHIEPVPDKWVDMLFRITETDFPSVSVRRWDSMFDGVRRETLVLRLRSDSSDDIVALGQRIARTFNQSFVGIETDSKYIRVYNDDTG